MMKGNLLIIFINILFIKTQFLKTSSALFLTGENANISFRLKNKQALITLGLLNNDLVLATDDYKYITFKSYKSVEIKGLSILTNTLHIEGHITYLNTPQWRLIYHDSFSQNNTSLDWNHDKITECNYFKMLGGYCQLSDKEAIKTYTLPEHKDIKIEALYHFIGKWDSNTGYMKISKNGESKYVWSNRCTYQPQSVIRLCPDYDVCKLAAPISITMKYSDKDVKLTFGSTLDNHSCEKSYGISDIRIYIK